MDYGKSVSKPISRTRKDELASLRIIAKSTVVIFVSTFIKWEINPKSSVDMRLCKVKLTLDQFGDRAPI